MLDDKLGISSSRASCASSVGLPLAFATPQGQPVEVPRGMLLTSIPKGDGGDSSEDSGGDHWENAPAGTQTPLASWTAVCRKLRGFLGRGHGNYHLGVAYAQHGIKGRPKILIPSNTRMVVYSSRFLQQSFDHYVARYQALWASAEALRERIQDPSNKNKSLHKKKLANIGLWGSRLCDPATLLPSYLIHLCFQLAHGFIAGALEVQTTTQVFFPLHLCSYRVWWHLLSLGEPPTVAARYRDKIVLPSEGRNDSVAMRIGFRCKECGLLKGSGAELLEHVKDCHTHEGAPRRTNYCESSLLSPDEVLRPSCVFRPSMSERPLAWAMSAEQACLGLGARQEGAAAPSLFELERLFNLFGILLSYACLPGDLLGVGPDTRGEALSFLECLKFFVVVLGSPQCKPLWSSLRPYMRWCTQYVATGLWRGCCLSRFSALAPLREQMASRKKCAAVLACSAVQQATLQASAFFKALRRGFYEEVLLSHGNHVPIAVRDYATVLFWLPDVLEAVQAKSVDFWKLARVCMPKVAAYVGNQVSMYDWPSTEQLVLQYYKLMRRWSVLIGSPDVRCKAYPARKRSCLGAEPAKEGVLFDWRWWWKQSQPPTVAARCRDKVVLPSEGRSDWRHENRISLQGMRVVKKKAQAQNFSSMSKTATHMRELRDGRIIVSLLCFPLTKFCGHCACSGPACLSVRLPGRCRPSKLVLANVPGHYLEASRANPQAHARKSHGSSICEPLPRRRAQTCHPRRDGRRLGEAISSGRGGRGTKVSWAANH